MLQAFPKLHGIVAASPKAWDMIFDVPKSSGEPFTREGDWAKVVIAGPLTQHGAFWCESYDAILTRAAAAFASDAKSVCLSISSPGGDFAGCIEAARTLRKMARESGKHFVAFTDSNMHSAAYALGCAADEIVATDSAELGNVGVWAPLVSTKGADKAAGVDVEIISSGPRKADRNPHVAITDAARDALQDDVDAMAGLFFAWVKEARGVDAAPVGGAGLLGRKALEVGFADKIVNDWSEYVSVTQKGASSPGGGAKMSAKKDWMSALRAAAEDGDKDAKKALAAAESEPEPKDKDKEAAAKKKAEADDKEKKDKEDADAKAKAEEDDKKDKEEKAKKASAASVDVSAELAKLSARAASEDRAKLMATRPDFTKEQVAFLATCTLEQVANACATFPKAEMPNAAAASNTTATVKGATQGEYVPGAEEAIVAKAMGQGPKDTKFYLGCGNVEAAREYLKSQKEAV